MIYGRFEKLRKLIYRRFRSTLGWSGKWGGVVLSIRIFSLMPQSERIPRSYQPGPLSRCGSVTERLCLPPAAIHYRSAASLPGNCYVKRLSLSLEPKERTKLL